MITRLLLAPLPGFSDLPTPLSLKMKPFSLALPSSVSLVSLVFERHFTLRPQRLRGRGLKALCAYLLSCTVLRLQLWSVLHLPAAKNKNVHWPSKQSQQDVLVRAAQCKLRFVLFDSNQHYLFIIEKNMFLAY